VFIREHELLNMCCCSQALKLEPCRLKPYHHKRTRCSESFSTILFLFLTVTFSALKPTEHAKRKNIKGESP